MFKQQQPYIALSNYIVSFFLLIYSSISLASKCDINCLIETGKLDEAQQKINIARSLNPSPEPAFRLKMAMHQGDIFFYQHKISLFRDQYFSAAHIADQIGNHELQAEALFNIAISYSENGQYGLALKFHDKTASILNLYSVKSPRVSIKNQYSQAIVYANIGAFEQAIETLKSAQNDAYEASFDQMYKNGIVREASIYLDQERWQAALNSLSTLNSSEINDVSTLNWFFGIKISALLQMNQINNANSAIQNALVQLPDQYNLTFLALQVESDIKAKDIVAAEQSMQRYKSVVNQNQNSWFQYYLEAEIFALKKQWKLALKSYLTADKIISNQFMNAPSSTFFRLPKGLYSQALLAATHAEPDNNSLLFELFWKSNQAQRPALSVNGVATNQIKTRETAAENELVNDVFENSPILQLWSKPALDELQNRIPAQSMLIAYVGENDQYLAMVLSKDQMKVYDLDSTSQEITQLVISLNLLLDRDEIKWTNTANKIHNILIDPLQESGLFNYKRIYIVPDQASRFIPFDILPDNSGESLVNNHEIILLSWKNIFSSFLNSDIDRENLSSELAIISRADGELDIAGHWRTAYRDLANTPSKLVYAAKESNWLKKLSTNTTSLNDSFATETAVKSMIKKNHGVIHFSTHGFDNPYSPAFSALILGKDEVNDGLFQAREVAQLNIPAKLVVLSSCSSARGGLQGGYGLSSGFAEAFIEAGSQTVVGTLRDIRDDHAFQFNKWFYQGLYKGLQVSTALHRAKHLARESQWPAREWSAYVLLGKASTTIHFKNNFEPAWQWYLLGFFTLIFCIIYLNHQITE